MCRRECHEESIKGLKASLRGARGKVEEYVENLESYERTEKYYKLAIEISGKLVGKHGVAAKHDSYVGWDRECSREEKAQVWQTDGKERGE